MPRVQEGHAPVSVMQVLAATTVSMLAQNVDTPSPSDRRAELPRVLVLSGELKYQPECLDANTSPSR
jgi:hypothetical protein